MEQLLQKTPQTAVQTTDPLYPHTVQQFTPRNEILRKYDLARTYMERFSGAPGDPYHAVTVVNFMNVAILWLSGLVKQGVFESKEQEEFTQSLLREYLHYQENFRKASDPINSIK
jgi:hypothetical protein